MGFLLWFLFNCAPHLLFSVIDFAVHSGVDDLSSIITSFPQILLSPVFTLFGFRRFKGQLVLSSQVSWTSCLITWLGCGVSLIYMADIVMLFPRIHKDNNLKIAWIPVALFYSTVLTAVVLHLPYFKKSREGKTQERATMTCGKRIRMIFLDCSILFKIMFFVSLFFICLTIAFLQILTKEVWFAKNIIFGMNK